MPQRDAAARSAGSDRPATATRAQGGVAARPRRAVAAAAASSSSSASISVGWRGSRAARCGSRRCPGRDRRDPAVHLAADHAVGVVGEHLAADGQPHAQAQRRARAARRRSRSIEPISQRSRLRRPAERRRCAWRAPAPATPSARCPSCAGTRWSAARAASPACRAASPGRAGRPRRGTTSVCSPPGAGSGHVGGRTACSRPRARPTATPLTQTARLVVDRAEVQEQALAGAQRRARRRSAGTSRRAKKPGVADAAAPASRARTGR